MDLLLLADPSEHKIRSYLPRSTYFVAESGGAIVGACIVQPRGDIHELMAIAVHPARQREGIGAAMLRYAIAHCRRHGVRRLEVGTGSFGYQLAFYQRHGFRVVGIEHDFFVRHYPEPVVEDGIQLRDMLRLALAPGDAAG